MTGSRFGSLLLYGITRRDVMDAARMWNLLPTNIICAIKEADGTEVDRRFINRFS